MKFTILYYERTKCNYYFQGRIMNIKKYHITYKILISLTIFIIILFTFPNNTIIASPDETAPLSQAPNGIPVGEYFSINDPIRPSVADNNYPFMHNSATVDSNNSNILSLAKGSIRANDATNKDGVYGAAWADKNKDNYIDISKKQTVSVWLYFGAGNSTDQTTNGEGMSLVLHNDPRKNSNGQSQALGAGYQALGSLGYDRSIVPYTKEGITWYGKSSLPSSTYVAGTAIQNSIALNFDTDINDTLTGKGLNISKNGPLYLYETPAVYNVWTLTGLVAKGITEYSLGGFDTVDGLDPFGKNISHNFPGYNELHAQRPAAKDYPLRQGNSGGLYGHISATYPGNPLTYQLGQIGPTVISKGDFSKFSNNSEAMSTVQAFGKSATLINGSDSSQKPVYWHHLTFTWNPAKDANGNPTKDGMPVAGGTLASMDYKFNDKLPNGSSNTLSSSKTAFYKEVDDSIPVDSTQFKLANGDTKVYWGLTGANSNTSDVFSKLAIFESIPALATADITSSITDNDLLDNNGKKTVITDSDSTTTVPKRTVSDGNNLTFNYNLKYDPSSSHQNWKDITARINLPVKDVKFSQAGTITYHTNAGQSNDQTETETIPIDWQLNNEQTLNELHHKLAYDLGNYADAVKNPKNFTSADISFNGVADNTSNVITTVDPEPASFMGSNAIESTSSPRFLIDNNMSGKKVLQLNVSDTLEFQNINYQTTKQIIKRKTPFTLNVTSLKSPWILQVSTDGLALNGDGKKFNGNFIYKKTDSSTPITLSNTLKDIASDNNSYESITTSYLANDWNSNSGLLLQPIKVNNQAGKYSGKLVWDVIEAPNN